MENHAMPALEKSRREINEIIVHCTATRAGRQVSLAEIDSWHRQRGFSTIGYHYVVALDGTVSPGRSPHLAGAHCLGHNSKSIAVVYVGGLDSAGHAADTRTDAQKAALTALLKALRGIYPNARIRSHRDFAAKDCPCFNATAEYAAL